MKLIDISTPKFPNTFTMVDDADFDWLNQWKWSKSKHSGYAVRTYNKYGERYDIYMHLEILKPPRGMHGDHRNGNRLDNRRENLRPCTPTENSRNRKPTAGRTLPKGVEWRPEERRYRARIKINRRNIHLGVFATVDEADAAYREAATKYFGEFVRVHETNHPDLIRETKSPKKGGK